MNGAGGGTAGPLVAVALGGREEETVSPAFGGGGTGEYAAGAGFVAVGFGTAPGCGAGGDWEEVGRVLVGVAVRLPDPAAVAVGTGRLGAVPGVADGCAVAGIEGYEGAVAVADVFGGCGSAVVAASMEVAGSGCEVVALVLPCSSACSLELRGADE